MRNPAGSIKLRVSAVANEDLAKDMAGKSLRDQLVEAGLASASQAKKAEREQKRANRAHNAQNKNKNKKKGQQDASEGGSKSSRPQSAAAIAAKQRQAAKARRDKELAAERNAKAQAKAVRAQIKQLIAQNDQRLAGTRDDDVPYNFKHGKKVKRIYVPAAQVEALSSGKLVIVNNDGRYNLVGKDVAAQIAQRDPKWIVTAHEPSSEAEEMDEYYKQFEVPDDLDW